MVSNVQTIYPNIFILQSSLFKFDLIILASSLRMTIQGLSMEDHESTAFYVFNLPMNLLFLSWTMLFARRCKTNEGHGIGYI